jgi:tRNA (adenine57-N1/adenine58-N1)-methyltransferase
MDFAKSLAQHENVVTISGIKLLDIPPATSHDESTLVDDNSDSNEERTKNSDISNHVKRLVLESANRAATHLLTASGTKIYSTMNKIKERKNVAEAMEKTSEEKTEIEAKNESLVDCTLYSTQLIPSSNKILPNALVVIFESFDSLNFVYATPGAIFYNRNGHFYHDDFIDRPYGCMVRSRNNKGVGYVHLLKPTPELWQRSLNHRTQIVHELDASLITFQLNLRPNMVVCESGTGSGALSHCIMRTIAPFGKLHTFEFNQARVKAAREEFKKNGVDHLVKVHWRDVCGTPTSFEKNDKRTSDGNDEPENHDQETIGAGGFVIGAAKADAIFLDLPEPWRAIPHAAHTIKPYGSICSYSPCVEQSQQTIQEMKRFGFHSIKTIEVRLREHYVDEVTLERPPTMKLTREPVPIYVPGKPSTSSPTEATPKVVSDEDKELNAEKNDLKSAHKRAGPTIDIQMPDKKRKMICARPFATMKGHTAFLTFAHAGNSAHPDPNLTTDEM